MSDGVACRRHQQQTRYIPPAPVIDYILSRLEDCAFFQDALDVFSRDLPLEIGKRQ